MKVLAVAVCLSFLVVPVRAQSLGELAEKEKARRAAAAKKGKKTYTEDDLKRAGGRSASFPEGSSATETASDTKPAGSEGQPAVADAKPPKSDSEIRAERRTDLQTKMDQQMKRKADLQKRVADAERILGDPGHNMYGSGHAETVKALEDSKQELAKIDQTVADLDDQARRLGVSLNH